MTNATAEERHPAGEGGRALRSDARRNRARILESARTCLACDGHEAQIDDIARAAGVGVGTVYRHFPTKEALLDALADERFAGFAEKAGALLDDPDPWHG